jgi:hypothetical protein
MSIVHIILTRWHSMNNTMYKKVVHEWRHAIFDPLHPYRQASLLSLENPWPPPLWPWRHLRLASHEPFDSQYYDKKTRISTNWDFQFTKQKKLGQKLLYYHYSKLQWYSVITNTQLGVIQIIRDTLGGRGLRKCHQMTHGGGGVFKSVTWHFSQNLGAEFYSFDHFLGHFWAWNQTNFVWLNISHLITN